MNSNKINVSNNDSNTEVSKQLYHINAAYYINVLIEKYCDCKDDYYKEIVKMENYKEKLLKHEEKVSHYQEKARKHFGLSSHCQYDMDFNDDLIREFFSDKTYPWLTDDSLSDEEKDLIAFIAHDRGMCPYCHDDEFEAEKIAA
jgi:hypothetical protein